MIEVRDGGLEQEEYREAARRILEGAIQEGGLADTVKSREE